MEGRGHDDVVLNRPVTPGEWIVERGGNAQKKAVAERRVPIQTQHGSPRENPTSPDGCVNRKDHIDAAGADVVIGAGAGAEVGDLQQGASAGIHLAPAGADVTLEAELNEFRDRVHRGAVAAAPRPHHEIVGGPSEIRTGAQTQLPVPTQRLTERDRAAADFGSSDILRARPSRRPRAEQHCGDENADSTWSHNRPFAEALVIYGPSQLSASTAT